MTGDLGWGVKLSIIQRAPSVAITLMVSDYHPASPWCDGYLDGVGLSSNESLV